MSVSCIMAFMKQWVLGLIAGAAVLGGCTRVNVESTVKEDGSWNRSVSIEYMDDTMGGESTLTDLQVKLKKEVQIPADPKWKKTYEKSESGLSYKASRDFAKGETLAGDLTFLEKGKVMVTNAVTVSQPAPGEFEYREVFQWKGPKTEDADIDKRMLAEAKAVLGDNASKVTDDELKQFADKTARKLVRALLGPNEPMILTMLVQPTLAERKLNTLMGGAMLKAAEESFGSKLNAAERRAFVRKLMSKESLTAITNQNPNPEEIVTNSSSGDDQGVQILEIAVTLPGEVVETNGMYDPVTGVVYWSFMKEAAEMEDVVLYAKTSTK